MSPLDELENLETMDYDALQEKHSDELLELLELLLPDGLDWLR